MDCKTAMLCGGCSLCSCFALQRIKELEKIQAWPGIELWPLQWLDATLSIEQIKPTGDQRTSLWVNS